MRKIFLTLCSIIAIGLTSCDKEEKKPDEPTFNRREMLQFYADDMIIPAFEKSLASVQALASSLQQLTLNPSMTSLDNARVSWKQAILDWQSCNGFNLGPAAEQGLRKTLNEEIATFPVSEDKLNAILSTGTFALNDFNRDARGFFAIEYLLYQPGQSNQQIIDSFQGSSRITFLTQLASHLTNSISSVVNEWKSSYRVTFIQNDGTDAGSSTSILYNEFIKSYEALKNFKLGLPLGLRPGQINTEPHLVEAFYSEYSLDLMKAHFNSNELIWRGGSSEKGFKAYLKQVVGGPELIATTENQLNVIRTAFQEVPLSPSVSQQITQSPDKLTSLYTEISKHTKNFKSDMSSLLGIAITFSSGDGD